MVNFGASIR